MSKRGGGSGPGGPCRLPFPQGRVSSAGASGSSRCGEPEGEACRLGGGERMFAPNIRVEEPSTEELCGGGLAVSKNWCYSLSGSSALKSGDLLEPTKLL